METASQKLFQAAAIVRRALGEAAACEGERVSVSVELQDMPGKPVNAWSQVVADVEGAAWAREAGVEVKLPSPLHGHPSFEIRKKVFGETELQRVPVTVLLQTSVSVEGAGPGGGRQVAEVVLNLLHDPSSPPAQSYKVIVSTGVLTGPNVFHAVGHDLASLSSCSSTYCSDLSEALYAFKVSLVTVAEASARLVLPWLRCNVNSPPVLHESDSTLTRLPTALSLPLTDSGYLDAAAGEEEEEEEEEEMELLC